MKESIKKLKRLNIKTIDDLDIYRAKHDRNNSRYGVLSDLVGKDAAMWLLNDLAIKQCTKAVKTCKK